MTMQELLTAVDALPQAEMEQLHQHLSEILGRKTDWRTLVQAIEGLREGLSEPQLDKIQAAMEGQPEAQSKP